MIRNDDDGNDNDNDDNDDDGGAPRQEVYSTRGMPVVRRAVSICLWVSAYRRVTFVCGMDYP